jgi:hypothetical protein
VGQAWSLDLLDITLLTLHLSIIGQVQKIIHEGANLERLFSFVFVERLGGQWCLPYELLPNPNHSHAELFFGL